MKKIMIGAVLSIICGAVFSQSQQLDVKLLSKYSSEYLQELASTNPRRLDVIKFECIRSFKFEEFPQDKVDAMEKLCYIDEGKQKGDVISEVDPENFNLFNCYYQRKLETSSYYRIGETNLVLVLMSEKEFATEFNKTQNYE